MCHTTLVLYFHLGTSFDLTLTLTCTLNLSIIHIASSLSLYEHFLKEFALAAVSGLVSAADRAKRVRFDL